MRLKFARIAAVAAGTAAAVGVALILLVVLSVADSILRDQPNQKIFLIVVAGAFLGVSIVVGASTYRFVQHLLTTGA